MSRTNNCSSSGGLYKQFTVFYCASLLGVQSLIVSCQGLDSSQDNNNNNNNNNNNIYLLQLGCYTVGVVILHVYKTRNWLLLNLSLEGYMRSMQWQLGILGIISAFAFMHKETKKNLCRGGPLQDLPNTDFKPAVRHLK